MDVGDILLVAEYILYYLNALYLEYATKITGNNLKIFSAAWDGYFGRQCLDS